MEIAVAPFLTTSKRSAILVDLETENISKSGTSVQVCSKSHRVNEI